MDETQTNAQSTLPSSAVNPTRGGTADNEEEEAMGTTTISWIFRDALARVRLALVCTLAWVGMFGAAQTAQAQVGRMTIPNAGYFTGFGSFYEGDFKTAGQMFRQSASAGFNSTEGRWIDSICFHTMISECYYQMGDMANAADQYSAAVKLFIAYRDWMLRAEFTPIESEANSKNPVTWGVSQRRTRLGHFPDHFQLLQGNSAAENQLALQKGGVVVPQELYSTYVGEICRCTALSSESTPSATCCAVALGPYSASTILRSA